MLGVLERVGQDERDRLALMADLVVLERDPRGGRGRHRRRGQPRQVGMGEHASDTGQRLRLLGIDPPQAAGRDRSADEHAVEHPVGAVVGRVARRARHLERAILARQRLAKRGAAGAHRDSPAAIRSALRAAPTASPAL